MTCAECDNFLGWATAYGTFETGFRHLKCHKVYKFLQSKKAVVELEVLTDNHNNMGQNYTPEQVEDIKAREQKGLDALKELQLTPAAQISKVNIGNDVFADKLIPFLQDTKHTLQESPITKDEVSNPKEA